MISESSFWRRCDMSIWLFPKKAGSKSNPMFNYWENMEGVKMKNWASLKVRWKLADLFEKILARSLQSIWTGSVV